MKKFLCLVALVISFSTNIYPYKAIYFDGAGLVRQEKLMALTLAGIVNRDSARLYLVNVYDVYSYTDNSFKWADIYKTKGNVEFEKIFKLPELIEKFRSFIKGAITFDKQQTFGNFDGQSFPWQNEYACLIGGLTNRLPLTPEDAVKYNFSTADSVLIEDKFDQDPPIWVTGKLELASHSWNKTDLSDENRYLTLVKYGMDKLLPRCNPSKFFIREITDFTIQQRMFQVNLGGKDEIDINAMPANRAEIIETCLNYFHSKNPTTIFHVYGWIRPEPLVQWISTYGASMHEVNFANISFHNKFPTEKRTYKSPVQIKPDSLKLEDKYYVVFIGTEGDAGNWVLGLQGGAWTSTTRGKVPVTWGWNLHLLELCPFVADYYYDTATPNDGFVSVTTPLGYAYPDLWNDDVLADATTQSNRLMEKFDIHNVYGYKHYAPNGKITFRNKILKDYFDITKYANFQNNTNVDVTYLYERDLPGQYPVKKENAIFFSHAYDDTFYGESSNTITFANRILATLKKRSHPGFMIGGYQRLRIDNFTSRTDPTSQDISMPMLKSVVDKLYADPDIGSKIEVITIEKFSGLIKKFLINPNVGIFDASQNSPLTLENFPNPFSDFTTIRYSIRQKSEVIIEIYDIYGKKVALLENSKKETGTYTIDFHTKEFSNGIYICSLKSGNSSRKIKIVLNKL